jgi:hypothetical protein
MVLYLYVLIVFSLHRESLNLILVTNPSLRWFCHKNRLAMTLVKNQSTDPHYNSHGLTCISSNTSCARPKNPSNRSRDCRHRINEQKNETAARTASHSRRRKISGRGGPVRPKSQARKESTRRQKEGGSGAPSAAATRQSRRKRAAEEDEEAERKELP